MDTVFCETDVWYVKVAFNVHSGDKRSDKDLLLLSVALARQECRSEIEKKHSRLGGKTPEYVQFVVHRDNPPNAAWRGRYSSAAIISLDALLDSSIAAEDLLEEAVVRTPPEEIPGEWYVDMAIAHYDATSSTDTMKKPNASEN